MAKTRARVALAALLIAACDRPSTEVPTAALCDQVTTNEALVLVPDLQWQADDQPPGWSFRHHATLLLWVGRTGIGPLRITLRPDADTARQCYRLLWDEKQLPASPPPAGGEGIQVDLAPDALTPGRHQLSLERQQGCEPIAVRNQRGNRFPEIRFRYGGDERRLETAHLPRYRRLAQFLQLGVVGDGKERRGGLLAVGPSSYRLAMPRKQAVRLRFEPRNFSPRPAVFRVDAGGERTETTVAAGGRGELAVAVAAPAVTLTVAGAEDGLFLWGMPRTESQASRRLPPIVLITLDTTRRDALSVYGGRPEVTPHLAALARQATVFDRACTTAPWTLPAHASIFTGLYPSQHGAGVTAMELRFASDTMARRLRARGYLTAGFSAGDLSASRLGLALGFSFYRDPDHFQTPGGRVAEYVEAFVQRYAEGPLFLFVNYFDPHSLYQAPREYEELLGVPALRDKVRHLRVWKHLVAGKIGGWHAIVTGRAPVTPEALAYLRAAYLAEVAWADHLAGRLFAQLKDLGLYDRALIVVTADHGELLGERGQFDHNARLDPELVEVPLLIKWPRQRRGERVTDLVSLVDLFPTILHAAGIVAPPSEGRILGPDRDPSAPRRRELLLEEHVSLIHPLPPEIRVARHLFGVQRAEFRQLIWEGGQECARRRPEGWIEVPCASAPAAVLEAVEARLRRRRTDPELPAEALPDEVRESLEALGYL